MTPHSKQVSSMSHLFHLLLYLAALPTCSLTYVESAVPIAEQSDQRQPMLFMTIPSKHTHDKVKEEMETKAGPALAAYPIARPKAEFKHEQDTGTPGGLVPGSHRLLFGTFQNTGSTLETSAEPRTVPFFY
eukprot:CAMPEP_0119300622 /NCGR_PEP_ID=MMETSP1333-20130426/2541_1 /TAXON_ID=418940 /ORGANISM="Scyphosphaera apsteinii, Strain RCC1455" /LENGTH=130 /DNA_ID=CAMNT_0007302459 /DNA_START=145 /DNA_END=537 /DNA_ORIENTATION=+